MGAFEADRPLGRRFFEDGVCVVVDRVQDGFVGARFCGDRVGPSDLNWDLQQGCGHVQDSMASDAVVIEVVTDVFRHFPQVFFEAIFVRVKEDVCGV